MLCLVYTLGLCADDIIYLANFGVCDSVGFTKRVHQRQVVCDATKVKQCAWFSSQNDVNKLCAECGQSSPPVFFTDFSYRFGIFKQKFTHLFSGSLLITLLANKV